MDVDTVLLDRVFQPTTDRLATYTSCFGLARIALAVAVEAQGVALLIDLRAAADPAQASLALGVAALAFVGARQAWKLIRLTERQSRPGRMNLRRITLRWQRLLWLLTCSGMIGLLLPQPNTGSAFAALSCFAWVALIYFVSCSPAQPSFRSSQRWAPART